MYPHLLDLVLITLFFYAGTVFGVFALKWAIKDDMCPMFPLALLVPHSIMSIVCTIGVIQAIFFWRG